MGSKIQKDLIRTNIKNMLLAVMAINQLGVIDNFNKPFKSKLGQDAVYNFMVEESKYCSEYMKKHFNKKLIITKKDDEDFENSFKYWFSDNAFADGDVKVRDHCIVTGKFRNSVYRDCNIDVKLNHKIPFVFHKLKNYELHIIMQELGKVNFKITVIANGLEKYMSFNINNKLFFIDSFHFLNSSLNSLVKNLI